MTKALVLLDYQEALAGDGEHVMAPPLAAQAKERGVIDTAAKVLAKAREAGLLVVHVRLAFEPSYALMTNAHPRFAAYRENRKMLIGSPEAEFVAPLAPQTDEPIINKGCVDPFVGTALAPLLSSRGITDIIIGGVATHMVVESTARHACDLGIRVEVVEDMCASFDPDLHDFSITKMMPSFGVVTSADEIVGAL